MAENNIGRELYHYNRDLVEFNQIMDETGGELTPEAEAVLARVQSGEVQLASNMYDWQAEKKAFIDICKTQKKYYGELQKVAENSLENTKGWLLRMMVNNGVDKIADGVHKISALAGRESVEVDEDEIFKPYLGKIAELREALPPYITFEVKVLKTAVADALKRGELIQGAEIVRNPSITIK